MARLAQVHRPALAARRVGYLIAVAVNGMLLYLLNVQPGWQAISFVTEDATRVIALVNASLIAALVADAVYVAYDPPWIRSLGDAVTAMASLAALIGVWRVFPFAFSGDGIDWSLLVRFLLVISIGGTVIGIAVAVGSFVRTLANPEQANPVSS